MSVDVVLPCLDQPRAPSGVLASLAAEHEHLAGRGQRFDRCVSGQRDRARRPDRAREAPRLRRHAVLGLTPDGGWWPLGVRDPRHAEVLRDVPMSRGDNGKRTLGTLRIAGLRVALLRELSDVDIMATVGEGANKALEARFADAATSVFAAEEAL